MRAWVVQATTRVISLWTWRGPAASLGALPQGLKTTGRTGPQRRAWKSKTPTILLALLVKRESQAVHQRPNLAGLCLKALTMMTYRACDVWALWKQRCSCSRQAVCPLPWQ